MKPVAYSGRARLADNKIARQVKSLAGEWVSLPMGQITAGERAASFGTYTFGVYATGGVSIPGTGSAADVSMIPWSDGAGAIFVFKWNPSTHKMLVIDWAGTEVAAATDLSAITSHPFHATLSASAITPSAQARLTGHGRIFAVEFEVAADFTASTANYWTITARLRRMDQPNDEVNGLTLGSLSTQYRNLPDLEPQTVFASSAGQIYHESDRVVVTAAPAGNPGALLDATAWLRVLREIA